MKTLDSDSVLNCQGCREEIAPEEPKIILGAKLSGFQRLFIFHPACWQVAKLSYDPAARRLFAHLAKS